MKSVSRMFARLFSVTIIILIVSLFFAFPVFAQSGGAAASPIPAFTLTPEVLATIAGVVLSLVFSYGPGVNVWFAAKDETTKRGYMAILLLLIAAAAYGLSCANILSIGIACTQAGGVEIVWIWIVAVIGNQSAYAISPRTQSVKRAKNSYTYPG